MDIANRLICRYDEGRKGPLLICLGGIHGNEPAGVEAIRTVGTLLTNEPEINPDFEFSGRMIGLLGNIQALAVGKRFIGMDMNRAFTLDRINRVLRAEKETLMGEDREICELVTMVRNEISDYGADRVIILDIHSTSATGGIFVIANEDSTSIEIGKELHAPVILDFTNEVHGTTLGYFNKDQFNIDITTIVFECGQHEEKLSINRAIAAIINCMRTIGCVSADSVENKHDRLLLDYSSGLPKVSRLIERFAIPDQAPFSMARPYANFAEVKAGEVVAYLNNNPVLAGHDGLILLPRLQEQGNDGFFIVKPVLEKQPEGVTTS